MGQTADAVPEQRQRREARAKARRERGSTGEEQVRDERHERADRERDERACGGRRRRSDGAGVEPHLLEYEQRGRMLRVGEDPVYETGSLLRCEPAPLVHPGEDLALLIGGVTDLSPFEGELVVEEFALRSDRDALADGHREGPGEQAGNAG